jgi:hypothetical protein
MAEYNTQKERLDYLVQAFIDDSEQYKNLKVPDDSQSKREVLRSLMNIRMPYRMKEEVLKVQDEYLKERNLENGVVRLSDLSSIKEEGSDHPFGGTDLHLAGGYYKTCRRRHRQRCQLADARLLCADAYLHR